MKTKFLPVLLILSGLLVTADKTYACNDPPIADLDASPNPVCVGCSVTLDGRGSSDPDGEITKYEWDIDWDGNPDHFSPEYTESPGDGIAYHTYDTIPIPPELYYTVKLRVTDDDGATDTDTCTVTVVKVNSVSANKDVACLNENVIFEVTTIPPGHYDPISWSGGGSPATQEGGQTFTTKWLAAHGVGTKTVTATCCDSNKSKEVEIISDLTVMPREAYVCVGCTKDFQAWTCVDDVSQNVTTSSTFSTDNGSFNENELTAGSTPSEFIGANYVRADYGETSTKDTGGDCELTVVSIDITDDAGNPITATQTVCVGQEISLKTKILPSGLTGSNWQWVIAGEVIKDYKKEDIGGGRTKAYVVELSAADLQQSTVQFYWVDGADGRDVSVSCDIEDVTCTDTVQFNVKRPTLNSFTSTTGPVVVGDAWGSTKLSCGIPTNPGINYTAKVTPSAGFDGQLKFVQLVQFDYTATFVDDSTMTKEIFGDMWLDNVDPYGEVYNVTGGVQKTMVDNDSPALPLIPGFKKVRVFFELFDVFVMFKPTGTDPIWIPIGKLEWGWYGTAQSSDGGDTWSKTDGGQAENNPSGIMTTEFVEWPDTATETHPAWVL